MKRVMLGGLLQKNKLIIETKYRFGATSLPESSTSPSKGPNLSIKGGEYETTDII
jgi:hypothetical protein